MLTPLMVPSLLAMTVCGPALAQEAAPVEIEHSQEILVDDPAGDRQIRLMIWLPPGTPPEKGFPVLYLFDGDQNFGLFSDAATWIAQRTEMEGRDPVAVVAIGYPRGGYDLATRIYDLTPPLDPGHRMPERPNGRPWPAMGGGDAFLDLLADTIQPLVRDRLPVDPDRETLYGHSFGGLMVLHTLATRPDMFDAYAAISPSLWFNGGQEIDALGDFLAAPPPRPTRIPLMVMVGGAEQSLSDRERAQPQAAASARWTEQNRMVDNARDLARRLEETGGDHVALDFTVAPGADHGSIRALAAGRALAFAIDATAPAPESEPESEPEPEP